MCLGKDGDRVPESIDWWTPSIDVSEPDRLAEMRVGDVPGPLRDGYVVIARSPERGPCEVLVSPGAKPRSMAAISIRFPAPPWLPPARPIIDPRDTDV
jgi:hypothetical protein